MSNKKITDLVELTTPTTDDVLPVVDIATNTTRKVQLGNLPTPSAITTALAEKVPYTGASSNVDLGEFGISAGYIQADLTPTGTLQVGRMQWNATDATMDLRMGGNNVTQQIGQETFLYARNTSGSTLLNGKVVKVLGSTGTRTTVALSQANTIANAKATIGVLTEDIANNTEGLVTTFGLVRELNTSAFADGDILYLSSSSAGELTNVAPSIAVRVGICVRSHPSMGMILVGVEYETPLTNPSGVSGAIQFSDGSAFASDATKFFWDNPNKRLGIGTNTPATTLHIKGSASTAPFYVQNAANLGVFAIQDDTQIVSYASKFNIRSTGGDYGGWFQTNATQSLQITNNVYNNGTACALNLNGIGVLINSLPTNLGASARLHVLGQGSTSATTSLLVQNSAGQNALTVLDDKTTTMFGNTQVAVSHNGIAGNANAYRMLVRSNDGFSYVDGWADGTLKSNNYPMVFGSRSNKVGSDVTGATTQENGSPSIFGSAVWDISALVQINSTTRGFLPPRMTTTQKNAIATPSAGLVVYDSTTNKLCCYNGSTWNDLF